MKWCAPMVMTVLAVVAVSGWSLDLPSAADASQKAALTANSAQASMLARAAFGEAGKPTPGTVNGMGLGEDGNGASTASMLNASLQQSGGIKAEVPSPIKTEKVSYELRRGITYLGIAASILISIGIGIAVGGFGGFILGLGGLVATAAVVKGD